VDPEDHLERQERVFERKQQKFPVTQGNTLAGQNAEEFPVVPAVVIDRYSEIPVGQVKAKIKLKIQIRERGYIKVLHDTTVEGPVGSKGHKVRFPFQEGIADLCHRDKRRACLVKAEVDGDGVEDITEHSRECQEQDAAHGFLDSVAGKISGDVLTDGVPAMADMVTLPEAVDPGPVHLQEPETSINGSEFFKINEKVEDLVEKLVLLWDQSPVKDGAFIEAGGKYRGTHRFTDFLTAIAASNPAVQASS
jgi:hypothetical protein